MNNPLSYLLVAGSLGFGFGLIVYVALRRKTYEPALQPAGAMSGGSFFSSAFPEPVTPPRFSPHR